MPPQGDRTLTMARAIEILEVGEIEVRQQLPWSSNATFLVEVGDGEHVINAVYKPQRGERPLWDFAEGTLCLREMAAFVVSEALGWALVPPTVLRDGPWGLGAIQAFIPHDPEIHYLTLDGQDLRDTQRIAAFDVVINNADRKSGHVLQARDGRLWAIDHGVSFHVDPKLRTVIWDFAGQLLPEDVTSDLASLERAFSDPEDELHGALNSLLPPREIRALERRTRQLNEAGRFPDTDPQRRAIPWPPV